MADNLARDMEAALVEPKHPRVNGQYSAAEYAFANLIRLLVGIPKLRVNDDGSIDIVRRDPRPFVEEALNKAGIRYTSKETELKDGSDPFHDAKGWATITINPAQQDPGFVERAISAVEQISADIRKYTARH
jgi:hypothetical protein